MTPQPGYLEEVGKILQELGKIGFKPVLVGGMALVILGSRRVTRDFDFLITNPGSEMGAILKILYKRGLELVSKMDNAGNVLDTIDNRRIATVRLQLDHPESAHFFNKKTGLKIDLLFDFPLPAQQVMARSEKLRIGSHLFHIASHQDLLQLKKIAQAQRVSPSDAEDIDFLNKIR